jgi:H+/Cl- antiporter ClcA
LIGVAVGLIVGILLFLLLATRSGGSLPNRAVLAAKLAPLVLVLVLLLMVVITR